MITLIFSLSNSVLKNLERQFILWLKIIVTFFFYFLASGQEKEQARQIFTSSGASGILTNDLVKIMEQEMVGFKSQSH